MSIIGGLAAHDRAWQRIAMFLAAMVVLSLLPAATSSRATSDPGDRLVVFWRDEDRSLAAAAARDGLVARALSSPGGRRSVVVAEPGRGRQLMDRLRADRRVARVVPDAPVALLGWPADANPDDPSFASQWDLPLIGIAGAWARTTGSSSVKVAVIDTGLNTAHADFGATVIAGARNTITGDANVADGNGHGTHVAGTVAASTNNATGIAGIAPGVTLIPIKALSDSGSGYWSDILEAVDYARAQGADVINMSLGGSLSSEQAAAFAPTFSAAREDGALVVAAAGNSGTNSVVYPAAFSSVVSVASTTSADARSSFSTYNAMVDIAAPGSSILSTYGAGYAYLSGTSMAAPHVAGVAALLASLRPAAGPAGLEQYLTASAVDLGAPGRDDEFGHGRLDADAALDLAAQDDPDPSPSPSPSVEPSPSPSPSASPSASPSPEPSSSPGPSPSAGPSPSPSPEPSPSPSPTPSATPDTTAPVVNSLTAPAVATSVDGSFAISWSASDNVGVTGYRLEYRHHAASSWTTLTTAATARTVTAPASGTYSIRLSARDAAGNWSAPRLATTLVPYDDTGLAFSSGSTRTTSSAFYRGQRVGSRHAGAKLSFSFYGSSLYLLSTVSPTHGRMKVTIDGTSWTIDQGTAGSIGYRAVVFARSLALGKHRVVLTGLGTSGRPWVEIDAFAYRR